MTQPVRRIVIRPQAGILQIVGREDELGGCPGVIAYGNFARAKLIRVEKTYALYHELAPRIDDGT